MMGYGLFAWLPSFFVRSYGDVLPQTLSWIPHFLIPNGAGPLLYAGYYYGMMLLVGGILGIWLGGQISDRLGAKSKGAYALVPAVSFLLALPFFILGTMSDNLMASFFLYIIPTALGLVWLGPVISAFQHIVPPNMRATASALFLLINSLVGIGLGDFLIGLMSDMFKAQYAQESLRYSIMSGTIFYVLAAILLFISSKLLPKDWEE
jgi:predicted MFS family arabinose efflux permease